ncbi:MAG: hypothetical protein WC956_08840 [bacterium]
MANEPKNISAVKPAAETGSTYIERQAEKIVAYFERETGFPVYPACDKSGSVVFINPEGAVVGKLSSDGQRVELVRDGNVVDERPVSELLCEDDGERIADDRPPSDKPWSDQYLYGSSQGPASYSDTSALNQSAKPFSSPKPSNPYTQGMPEVKSKVAEKCKSPDSAREENSALSDQSVAVNGDAASSSVNPASAEPGGVILASQSSDGSGATLVPAAVTNQLSSDNQAAADPAASSRAERTAAAVTDSVTLPSRDNAGADSGAGTAVPFIECALVALGLMGPGRGDRLDQAQKGSVSQVKSQPSSDTENYLSRLPLSISSFFVRGIHAHAALFAAMAARKAHADPFAASPNRFSSAPVAMSSLFMNGAHTVDSDGLMIAQATAQAGLLTLTFPAVAQPVFTALGEDRLALRIRELSDPQHTRRDHGDEGQGDRGREREDRRDDEQHEHSS